MEKEKRGFSLIEILLAGAVLVAVLESTVVIMSSTFKNTRKAAAVESVNSEGMAALGPMENVIRYARSITCAANLLTVTKLNNDVITYDITANRLTSHFGGVTTYLSTTAVKVTPCSGTLFTCDSGENRSVGICFVMENSATVAGDVTTQAGENGVRFKSQVTLRNWGI